ncbi:MAG TPA: hypothetical protein VGM77_06775 [Gemmatimonadales bacterium]|jgi:hypothetical protein
MRLARLVRLAGLVFPVAYLNAQLPAATAHTDVPVKSVMLFSSGVGYFEHAGVVHGDGSAELRFKTAQINDILKSLVVQDFDGGKVTTITYPSQDPISKTLRSFQVDITNNPDMASLLNQLRGARVTVQTPAEHISGTILGVETRPRATDKGAVIETPTLNLLTGATIHSLELPAITALSLDDPQLQDELTKALQALSQSRDQDKKPVTINFTGNGERHVRIGYLVETPIWKTSYRLMMDGKSARLQGWAIVENQTESDWNNVSLSLVSGRPISFMMDLYQPLYVQRPVVVPDLYSGLRPQLYEGAIATSTRGGRLADMTVTVPPRAVLVPRDQVTSRQDYVDGVPVGAPSYGTAGQSVQSAATTSQLGELFQYAIANVTLARQKSAMIPIVTDTVGIERLSIYNASVLRSNPLNGVRLKNSTGKHLQQGPITVLDKGAYAGDARIDDVPPGQERLLSYGIDLDLLVDNSKGTQTGAVVTARINKGALLIERKLVSSQDYQVDNKGSHDKTIIIEHPVRAGWKLAEGLKPVETTPSVYRFQGNAAAGKVTLLTVKEENVRQETVTMLPADVGQLLTYSRTGEIPQPVRDAIAKAIQMKQAVIELNNQAATRTTQMDAITEEQGRIRENMKTVDSKTPYYDRLLTKLNEQESQIERLQKEVGDLQDKSNAQQAALADYLNGLTVG